jgi:hypothetical protein
MTIPGYILGSTSGIDDLFPAQRARRLTEREIEQLAAIDPTTAMSKGRLRALLERSTDTTDPARPLVEALLAVPVREAPPAPFANPARAAARPGSAGDKRPLTASDLEWIKSLPSDPAKVAPEDVSTLARMVQAASTSDLRFLRTVFEPIWAHYDVLEQQAERRAKRQEVETTKAARTRHLEQLAVQALTAHVQDEFPELRESEARNRAAERLHDRWADVDLAHQAEIDANRTWETPTPRPMPGIEGLSEMAEARERAERKREAAPTSPFDGLEVIGKVVGG